MSSVSMDVKPFRITTQTGLTSASIAEFTVKGRQCVVLKDESENGLYVPLSECLFEVITAVNPNGDKVVAFKDVDTHWYEISLTKGNLVKTEKVHGAVPNCSAMEIPYLILIQEAVA